MARGTDRTKPMLMLDANVLIYAYRSEEKQHAAARTWLERVFAAPEPIGLPWQTMLAFLRITANHRIFERPLPMPKAQQIVAGWLDQRQVHVIDAGEHFFSVLSSLLDSAQIRGPLVTDAALAALAIENGATLCTTDRDFARFVGLKWPTTLRWAS